MCVFKKNIVVFVTLVGRLNSDVRGCSVQGTLLRHASLFGLVTGWTEESFFFHEQDMRRADAVVHFSAVSTRGLPPLFFRPKKNKWFPSFYCMDFCICSLNAFDSCIARDRKLVPYSHCIQLDEMSFYIYWPVIFRPNILLCYSFWDNLLHYTHTHTHTRTHTHIHIYIYIYMSTRARHTANS